MFGTISPRKEASGLRLFSKLNGVQVVGGSNPLTPTLKTSNQEVVRQQKRSRAFPKRNLHPDICQRHLVVAFECRLF